MPAKSAAKSRLSGISYQLKITLRGSKPPIWRRIVVPAECPLETLHAAIQNAMGWYNSHLHAFEIDGQEFSGRDPMGGKMEALGMEDTGLDAAKYRLCDVAPTAKIKFNYQYDFGDGWNHQIAVEKILPPSSPSSPRPDFACLAGARACPPEDCGGIWGYAHLLKVLQDPKHEEHADLKSWAGTVVPESFDLAAVNLRLRAIRLR